MRIIEPASTTNTVFIGKTESGPTDPEVVTSWIDFQNKFGSVISDSFLPYAVYGFFENGGQRCFIARTIEEADYEFQLDAIKQIDEISIVNIPNATIDVAKILIAHCQALKTRFAILDAEQGSSINSMNPRDQYGSSRFAAVYYPWIEITHPVTGNPILVPPGGFVAGIFVRKDLQVGVHKAPANEIVTGALDLEASIHQNEQDVLASQGVNVIRNFPGRGILLWGARTLSIEGEWKYVNVRRLFSFIEQSIAHGTRWVVSEPNAEPLWTQVRDSITDFLIKCWSNGTLVGRTPKEAFFVKCDRTTMTQDDIDNGRLICMIGVAPIKPAEFVIFRICQWSTGTDIDD